MYLSGEGGRHCFRDLFDRYTCAGESMCPESDDPIGS